MCEKYICPFCGHEMIVYDYFESWLDCSFCDFGTDCHSSLSSAICEYESICAQLEDNLNFYLYGSNDDLF